MSFLYSFTASTAILGSFNRDTSELFLIIALELYALPADKMSERDINAATPTAEIGRAEIAMSDVASLNKERDVTEGVRKIENVTRSWSTAALAFAWAGMLLIAIAVSLDSMTVSAYQPYALSEFKEHSMLSAVSTLQNILFVLSRNTYLD